MKTTTNYQPRRRGPQPRTSYDFAGWLRRLRKLKGTRPALTLMYGEDFKCRPKTLAEYLWRWKRQEKIDGMIVSYDEQNQTVTISLG